MSKQRGIGFNELIQKKLSNNSADHVPFIQGAFFARDAILEVIRDLIDEDLNSESEPINAECEAEIQTLEALAELILKHKVFKGEK